jgi:hypothetical protein
VRRTRTLARLFPLVLSREATLSMILTNIRLLGTMSWLLAINAALVDPIALDRRKAPNVAVAHDAASPCLVLSTTKNRDLLLYRRTE